MSLPFRDGRCRLEQNIRSAAQGDFLDIRATGNGLRAVCRICQINIVKISAVHTCQRALGCKICCISHACLSHSSSSTLRILEHTHTFEPLHRALGNQSAFCRMLRGLAEAWCRCCSDLPGPNFLDHDGLTALNKSFFAQ